MLRCTWLDYQVVRSLMTCLDGRDGCSNAGLTNYARLKSFRCRDKPALSRRHTSVCIATHPTHAVPSFQSHGMTLKFHGSSFLITSSCHPRGNRACRACQSRMLATCACRARGIWRTTRHTDKRAAQTSQQTAGRPIRSEKLPFV